MNKISTLFSKHWRNLHFLLLIIVSLVIIAADAYVVPRIDKVFISVFYSPFTYIDENITNLKTVSDKNDELNKALTEISVKVSLLDEARLENERLRSILGFEKPPGYNLIPAEVISVSGDFVPISVAINKGELRVANKPNGSITAIVLGAGGRGKALAPL